MSHINKLKNTDPRKSPVSSHNGAKSAKSKPPKAKAAKTAPGMPVSNGFHEVVGKADGKKKGVATKEKYEVAKMNLLTLQKVDENISEIVSTVPDVILYEFKKAENMWVSIYPPPHSNNSPLSPL